MNLRKIFSRGVRWIIKGVPNNIVQANISYLRPDARLEGKRIIVTGGSRGLGFAMAQKFMREGAAVLIAGRNESVLRKASEQLGCEFLVLDVACIDTFESFLTEAESRLRGVDVLVNNAGISLHEGNFRNVSLNQFESQFDTNLKGGYFLSQKFVARLEEKKQGGSILFVSSERGSYVDDLPYGLTKVAVNSLVQGLSNRLVKSGIRVNAVAPGVTTSEMTGFKADGNLYCDYNINDRVYLPEEVAEVATFLLSDASKCLNGQILVCNEGKSINAHWR